MSLLTDIGAIDIRHRLPRRDWIIGQRSATTSLTWHYNGPEVAPERQHGDGLIRQLIADAEWQMRPGWGGTINGAPHLMYHLVVDALGTVYATADLAEILWHCAHADGNGRGLALHFPLGTGQEPTPLQLAAAFRVSDRIRAGYHIPFKRVVGHLEWKHATECPGPALMQHLIAYRAGRAPIVAPTPTPKGLRRWQIHADLTDKVNVREGPGTNFKVAGTLKPGTALFIDTEIPSEPLDPDHARWVHMARVAHEQADLGFIASELGRWLP